MITAQLESDWKTHQTAELIKAPLVSEQLDRTGGNDQNKKPGGQASKKGPRANGTAQNKARRQRKKAATTKAKTKRAASCVL